MEQNLQNKLDGFRRRIRRMTFYYGLSFILSMIFGSMMLFGLLDWWFRIDSPEGRLAFVSIALLLLAVSAWWFFIRPIRQGISDLQLAFAIERHEPYFGESLVSTVQFLENRNRQSHDSPALKDRLVQETIRQLEQVEFDRIIDTRPVRKIVQRAGMAIAFILAFALWNRSEAAIAMKRLFLPYGSCTWPKETQFLLLTNANEPLFKNDETRLRKPKGEMLTIFVSNEKGLLPADTQLQIYYPEEDDLIVEDILKRVPRDVGTGSIRYLGSIQIPVKQDQTQFRIQGGDDATPWYTIDVVPPPALENYRLVLKPPAYTGKKSVTISKGAGQLRAVLGTQIRIDARSNKKLNYVKVLVKNDSPRQLSLDSSKKKFHTEFLVRETGLYNWKFDLEDKEGFHNPRKNQSEIRVFEDRPPKIKLLSPNPLHNRDEILATPTATIPVHIQASDDFGLKQLELRYNRHHSEDSSKSLPLYQSGRKELSQEKKTMVYPWELRDAQVVEGMVLGFHVNAADHYRDPFGRIPSESHASRSKKRLLRIVTSNEKTNELQRRMVELIEKLETQQKIQANLVNRTKDLIIQLQQARNWNTRRDYRQLTSLEKKQRAVRTAIIDKKNGLIQTVSTIHEEAIYNHLHDPVLMHSLSYIKRELKSLSSLHLNRIDQQLSVVRKNAEDDLSTGSSPRQTRLSMTIVRQIEHLENARYHQIQVQAGLESLLAEFRQHRSIKDIAEELGTILQEEMEISRSTKESKRETFSKTISDLTPQQRADLFRLAEKQRRLSPRFGKLESDLEEYLSMSINIRQSRQLLQNLSRQFANSHLKSKMQQAARELQSNKLGVAEETISEILDSLHSLVQIISVRDHRDLSELITAVIQIERKMTSLRLKQKNDTNQVNKLSTVDHEIFTQLEQKERQLLADVEILSRSIRNWDAQEVADSFRRLQTILQNTVDTLRSRNRNLSRRNMTESLARFARVIDQLSRYRRYLIKMKTQEILLQIVTNITDMKNRQLQLIQRTIKLRDELTSSSRWTRSLSRKLFSIRDEEKKLRSESLALSQILKSAPAYEVTMKRVTVTLASIDERLRRRHADEKTIAFQQEVVAILTNLLTALESDSPDAQLEESPENGRNSPSSQEGIISALAQVKLIMAIQKELSKTTIAINNNLKKNQNISTEDKQNLTRMTQRQLSLRDSMQGILSKFRNQNSHQRRVKQTITLMQESAEKLTARNIGIDTQKIHQQIEKNLDILIRYLKEQQPKPSSTQTDNTTPFPNSNAKTKTKQSGRKSKSGTSAGVPGKTLKNKKKGISGSTQQSNLQSRLDDRKKMIGVYWGHLPEAVKLRLLNQTDEKFLMQYREQIKRYFESLATDPGKKR